MAKRNAVSFLLFLVYCIPYAFALMYFDGDLDILLVYPLPFAAFAGLGWYCGKTKRISVSLVGSFASCTLSLLLAFRYLMEDSHYFKPFGATGLVLFLCIYTLAVQMLIWRKQRGGKEVLWLYNFLRFWQCCLSPR